MADGASLAQRLVDKDKGSRLLPVALRASFVHASHHQTPAPFVNVHPMGVMALDAVHFAFENRVVLRHVDFRLRFQMTLQTCRRVAARINDVAAHSSPRCYMPAPWAMT